MKLDGVNIDDFSDTGIITLTGNSYSSNKTWVLSVTDDKGKTATKNATLQFLNRIYYGVAEIPSTIDNNFLFGLTNMLSNTKARKITVNPSSGYYIWYACPSRLGSCNFKVGGFDGGFELYSTFSHTNSNGYQENYYIYKSDNPSLGNTTVEVS